jgi:hypothetical protein
MSRHAATKVGQDVTPLSAERSTPGARRFAPKARGVDGESARISTHTNAKKIHDLVKLKAIGPEIAPY